MELGRIAIHGVPRSGTTWLGAILDSSPNIIYRNQPLFSYAFKEALSVNSTFDDVLHFFERISDSEDEFITQKAGKDQGLIPVFKKDKITHIAYKEARYHSILENCLRVDPNLKVIGIIRNPKSVLYSWMNAPKEFDMNHWSMEEEWRFATKKNQGKESEYYGFEKWKEVSSMFVDLSSMYPERFYLIKYDGLLESTSNEVQNLFDFVGLTMNEQTRAFIDNRSGNGNDDPYSVYRMNQRDDKWKDKLDISIVQAIDQDLSGTVLAKYNE